MLREMVNLNEGIFCVLLILLKRIYQFVPHNNYLLAQHLVWYTIPFILVKLYLLGKP